MPPCLRTIALIDNVSCDRCTMHDFAELIRPCMYWSTRDLAIRVTPISTTSVEAKARGHAVSISAFGDSRGWLDLCAYQVWRNDYDHPGWWCEVPNGRS